MKVWTCLVDQTIVFSFLWVEVSRSIYILFDFFYRFSGRYGQYFKLDKHDEN